jgi:hypothetical protein
MLISQIEAGWKSQANLSHFCGIIDDEVKPGSQIEATEVKPNSLLLFDSSDPIGPMNDTLPLLDI